MKYLHDEIVYSTDITLTDSPAFYDCVHHIICNAGTARFRYNGNAFQLRRDEIAVISRPRRISDVEASDDFACEYISAPEKFIHNLLPSNNYSIRGGVSLFGNPVMEVAQEDADRFRRDVANIRDRIDDSDHRFYQEMIGSLLRVMVYDLFDFHIKGNESEITTDRVGYIARQFLTLMEAGMPATQREVSFYADRLNVSPKYLSDTIRRVTGQSASAHINRAAAAIIIQYLNDSNRSITQIAEEMNFTSVSYFSRYCTKHIGVSPSQLRTCGERRRC